MASNMSATNIVVVTGKLMHLNGLLQNDHASIDLKTNVHSNINGKSKFKLSCIDNDEIEMEKAISLYSS